MKRKAVSIAVAIGPEGSQWQGTMVTRVLYSDGAWFEVRPADATTERAT